MMCIVWALVSIAVTAAVLQCLAGPNSSRDGYNTEGYYDDGSA